MGPHGLLRCAQERALARCEHEAQESAAVIARDFVSRCRKSAARGLRMETKLYEAETPPDLDQCFLTENRAWIDYLKAKLWEPLASEGLLEVDVQQTIFLNPGDVFEAK